jgi:hypothetical protein
MEKDKLKELVLKYISEILDEDGSTTAGVPGFLSAKAFKPKYESTTKAFTRNPARPITAQDKNSPTGFESMPDSAKIYIKGGFRAIKPKERIDAKDLWKEENLNEVRYSQFKTQSKTRAPQEQLHMGVKEIYRKLDEINRLVEFTSRMKTELKGDAEEMNFLKRTHNSLFKINEKIQSINEKIKGLTE